MGDDVAEALAAMHRFWPKVVKTDSCWLWTGALSNKGYGSFAVRPRLTRAAHRVAWISVKGAVPDGLQLDHLCRVRCCVNPDHLEPVTNRVNARRGEAGIAGRSKTHCPKGHRYSPENTYVTTQGFRECRTCKTARTLRSNKRRRQERRADRLAADHTPPSEAS